MAEAGALALRLAERVCKRLVGGVRVVEGALLLDADHAWAVNTVLVKKGVRVNELCREEYRAVL